MVKEVENIRTTQISRLLDLGFHKEVHLPESWFLDASNIEQPSATLAKLGPPILVVSRDFVSIKVQCDKLDIVIDDGVENFSDLHQKPKLTYWIYGSRIPIPHNTFAVYQWRELFTRRRKDLESSGETQGLNLVLRRGLMTEEGLAFFRERDVFKKRFDVAAGFFLIETLIGQDIIPNIPCLDFRKRIPKLSFTSVTALISDFTTPSCLNYRIHHENTIPPQNL